MLHVERADPRPLCHPHRYQAACSYLPRGAFIAPDVGAVSSIFSKICVGAHICIGYVSAQVFGTSGRVDFYISLSDDTGWAIELLRDGDRAQEHATRFAEGGKYADLPMSKYALIDFRPPGGSSVSVHRDNFFYVTFREGYKSAVLLHRDIATRIELQD